MLSELLNNKQIILASKSPRRQELLKGLNIPFEVVTKEVEETYPDDLESEKVAGYLALKKANAFKAELVENTILITADTVVLSGDKILGKPKNEEESRLMLNELSNNNHSVMTGVCIKSKHKTQAFSVSTKVKFKTLTPEEIDYYIKNYKPFDKAGSYGIQEWIGYIGIPEITGSYFNVMGLPVFELYDQLKSFAEQAK